MSEPTLQPSQPSHPSTSSSPLTRARGLFRRATSTLTGTIALGCGTALLVSVLCCGGAATIGAIVGPPPSTPTASMASTATTPLAPLTLPTMTTVPTATIHLIPTATPRPQPTATSIPQPVSGPYLGGTYPNFAAIYGPADDGRSSWSDTVIAGQHVALFVDTNSQSDSTDGQPRAYTIIVQPVPGPIMTWSDTQAQEVVAHLFPPDGKFEQTVQSSNGPDHIYSSADLAATFDAAMFTNQAGTRSVSLGTFDYQCKNGTYPNGAAVTICAISVGQQD